MASLRIASKRSLADLEPIQPVLTYTAKGAPPPTTSRLVTMEKFLAKGLLVLWKEAHNEVCETCDKGGRTLVQCSFCNLVFHNTKACLGANKLQQHSVVASKKAALFTTNNTINNNASATSHSPYWACPTCWRVACTEELLAKRVLQLWTGDHDTHCKTCGKTCAGEGGGTCGGGGGGGGAPHTGQTKGQLSASRSASSSSISSSSSSESSSSEQVVTAFEEDPTAVPPEMALCSCCDFCFHNTPECLGDFVQAEEEAAQEATRWVCPLCWSEVEHKAPQQQHDDNHPPPSALSASASDSSSSSVLSPHKDTRDVLIGKARRGIKKCADEGGGGGGDVKKSSKGAAAAAVAAARGDTKDEANNDLVGSRFLDSSDDEEYEVTGYTFEKHDSEDDDDDDDNDIHSGGGSGGSSGGGSGSGSSGGYANTSSNSGKHPHFQKEANHQNNKTKNKTKKMKKKKSANKTVRLAAVLVSTGRKHRDSAKQTWDVAYVLSKKRRSKRTKEGFIKKSEKEGPKKKNNLKKNPPIKGGIKAEEEEGEEVELSSSDAVTGNTATKKKVKALKAAPSTTTKTKKLKKSKSGVLDNGGDKGIKPTPSSSTTAKQKDLSSRHRHLDRPDVANEIVEEEEEEENGGEDSLGAEGAFLVESLTLLPDSLLLATLAPHLTDSNLASLSRTCVLWRDWCYREAAPSGHVHGAGFTLLDHNPYRRWLMMMNGGGGGGGGGKKTKKQQQQNQQQQLQFGIKHWACFNSVPFEVNDDESDDASGNGGVGGGGLPPLWPHEHNFRCEGCGMGGDIICCDYCNVVWHGRCLMPPLLDDDHMPSESQRWACPACAEDKRAPVMGPCFSFVACVKDLPEMVRNRLLVRGGGGGGNRQLGRKMRESGSGGGFGGRSGGGSGSGDSGGGGGGGKGGVSNGLEGEVMVGGDDGLGVDGADDGEEDGHVQFLFVFGGYHSASFTPNTDVYALRLTPIPPPPSSSSSSTTLNGTQEEVEESTGGVDFEVAADIADTATVFFSKPLPTVAPLLPVWQRLSVKGAKHSKTHPPASSSSSSSSSASSTSSDFSSTPGFFGGQQAFLMGGAAAGDGGLPQQQHHHPHSWSLGVFPWVNPSASAKSVARSAVGFGVMFVLDLATLQWRQLRLRGEHPSPRTAFAVTMSALLPSSSRPPSSPLSPLSVSSPSPSTSSSSSSSSSSSWSVSSSSSSSSSSSTSTSTTSTSLRQSRLNYPHHPHQPPTTLPPQRLFLFGGMPASGGGRRVLNDTFVLHLNNLHWSRLELDLQTPSGAINTATSSSHNAVSSSSTSSSSTRSVGNKIRGVLPLVASADFSSSSVGFTVTRPPIYANIRILPIPTTAPAEAVAGSVAVTAKMGTGEVVADAAGGYGCGGIGSGGGGASVGGGGGLGSLMAMVAMDDDDHVGCTSGLPGCYCLSGRTRAIERVVPITTPIVAPIIATASAPVDPSLPTTTTDAAAATTTAVAVAATTSVQLVPTPPPTLVSRSSSSNSGRGSSGGRDGGDSSSASGHGPGSHVSGVDAYKVLETYCSGTDAARKLCTSNNVVSSHLNGRTSTVKGHLLRFRGDREAAHLQQLQLQPRTGGERRRSVVSSHFTRGVDGGSKKRSRSSSSSSGFSFQKFSSDIGPYRGGSTELLLLLSSPSISSSSSSSSSSPSSSSSASSSASSSSSSSSLSSSLSSPTLVCGRPGARSGHSLTKIGRSLFLFGGLGRQSSGGTSSSGCGSSSSGAGVSSGGLTYLNDIFQLELQTITVDEKTEEEGGREGCREDSFQLHQPPTQSSAKSSFNVPVKGRWWKLHCKGKPPAKRAEHSALAVGPYLVVCGGTNSKMLLPTSPLHLFHTPTLTWSITAAIAAPPPRLSLLLSPSSLPPLSIAAKEEVEVEQVTVAGGAGAGVVEEVEEVPTEPSPRMRCSLTLRPPPFRPDGGWGGDGGSSQRIHTNPSVDTGFPELLVFGGGPWQCVEATHSAIEHEGDLFRAAVGGS